MPSNGGSPYSTRWRSRMSAYSIGKMSAEPRHSVVVSVSGAGLPASVHARDAADAAASRDAIERVDDHEHVVVGAFGDVLAGRRRAVQHDRAQRGAVGRAQLRDEFVESHSRHVSPGSARAAAAETASATETAKPSAASATKAATATESATAPAAAADHRRSAERSADIRRAARRATEHRENEEQQNEPERTAEFRRCSSTRPRGCARPAAWKLLSIWKWNSSRSAGRRAASSARCRRRSRAALKVWNRLVANLAGRRVGDEAFGAECRLSMRTCPWPSALVSFGTTRMMTPVLRAGSPGFPF